MTPLPAVPVHLRHLPRAHFRTLEGNYSLSGLVGFEMNKKVVGIIGTGAIGTEACRIMKVRTVARARRGLRVEVCCGCSAVIRQYEPNSSHLESYSALCRTNSSRPNQAHTARTLMFSPLPVPLPLALLITVLPSPFHPNNSLCCLHPCSTLPSLPGHRLQGAGV